MNKKLITLKELIENAHKILIEYGYAGFSLNNYLKAWSKLKIYADENEITYYSTKLFLAYSEEKFQSLSKSNDTTYKRRQYALLIKLDEYYKFGILTSTKSAMRKTYCFDGCFEESIEVFLLDKSKFLSKARIQSYQIYLERFCAFIENNYSLNSTLELTGVYIVQFIEDCKIYTKPTVYATNSCLRQYLDYLFLKKIISTKLSNVLPKIKKRREKEIPSTYTKEEIEKLLTCFNLANPKEIRDYAMVLIAARLGLRSSDICALKFSEIDWEKNTISIVQQKTKHPAIYPLLKDIGEAIISYIKKVRPNISDEYIFLRLEPPYTKLGNGSMYTITEKYFTRAEINIPVGKSRGPHTLRHSLSSMLLDNNVALPIISEILAHKSSETTKAYLRIAEKQLIKCALPVPETEREVE